MTLCIQPREQVAAACTSCHIKELPDCMRAHPGAESRRAPQSSLQSRRCLPRHTLRQACRCRKGARMTPTAVLQGRSARSCRRGGGHQASRCRKGARMQSTALLSSQSQATSWGREGARASPSSRNAMMAVAGTVVHRAVGHSVSGRKNSQMTRKRVVCLPDVALPGF